MNERPAVLEAVRQTVRELLEQSPGFAEAHPDLRRSVAGRLVEVSMMGADLLAADRRLSERAAAPSAPALARVQDAGDHLGLTAAKAAAGTIKNVKDAIDFPTYVQSLITGVFQAITKSNVAQLTSLADLLDNVSASSDEFTAGNTRDGDAIQWALQKFSFMTTTNGTDLALKPDVEISQKRAEIKQALGATEDEVSGVDDGDLLGSLGPLIQRKIGRDRQAVLGTLVQMGLQRIVVDEGRLHASMDMRVDTRSAAEEDQASRTEVGVAASASASFGIGAWGASASVSSNFSHVQSDHQYTKEELDLRVGLRSSVDLAFRTEQVPLDKMAGPAARVRIDGNARVPANVSDGASIVSSERAATPVPANPAPAPPPKPPEVKKAAAGVVKPAASEKGAGANNDTKKDTKSAPAGKAPSGRTKAAAPAP